LSEISNTMRILNGKRLSERILQKIKREIKKSNLKLRLAVVQVGENPVSQIFINQKKKACRLVGIDFKLYCFDGKISPQKLKKEIKKIVRNPVNSGIIIQLPLPEKFLPEEFLNLIPREKDTDVLSEESLGKFYQGTLKILPPTVNGILCLLKNYKIELKGKDVVIIGAGRLVGFPLAIQLLKEKATLSVLNEFTKDTPFFIKKADILISGVGKPNLIKGKMVKKGVVIIDAGTSIKKGKLRRDSSGVLRDRLVGDVDFEEVSKKASYITPVPGGVGPLTVACLLENLVKLSRP
jgi:methylenetetrahydrofolate dehydrogenase (NADP+)/methenyltetrahydrofolate cyclohydrolase